MGLIDTPAVPWHAAHSAQTKNEVSVAAGSFRARRVAQGIPRRISKRRNAAWGLPAATDTALLV